MQDFRSVYIAFDVFPRPKGSSSHVASMVAAMARRHGPVLLLCCGYGDLPAHQVEGDVTICRHKVYHPNLLQRASEFTRFVERHLSEAGDQVEVCVFRDPWGGVPALDSALDCPMVFEVNALPSWELPYAYPEVARRPAIRAKLEDQERFCLLSSDRILTVSGVTREALIRIGAPAAHIAVVPNAAPDHFFRAAREPSPLPELEEGLWFGYFGSLHPWQGIETAVEAFALARDDLADDARMLVVHNGRKRPLKALRKRIRKRELEDRILLQPPLGPEALGAAVARLAFTLAPLRETPRNTLQGCCPVKIVESMAVGVPTIASNLRVCRELIRHGEDGWLVEPDAPRAWARAMLRLAKDTALAARLGRAARKRAKESFSWRKIHDSLESHFSMGTNAENPPKALISTPSQY